MKKYSLILAAIFFISLISSFQTIRAQDRTREERLQEEEKQKIYEEIDQQKKEMIEHRRSEEIQRTLQESRKDIDEAMNDVRERFHEYDSERDRPRVPRTPDVPFAFSFPEFNISGLFPRDDAERSSLSLSKSLKESDFDRDYIFDVAPTSKTVSMSITGYCKEGEIRIRIRMPNGKTYSDVMIDESGNLNWRKSFNISEEENMDKTGDWKYEITTKNATGYFRIALQTY